MTEEREHQLAEAVLSVFPHAHFAFLDGDVICFRLGTSSMTGLDTGKLLARARIFSPQVTFTIYDDFINGLELDALIDDSKTGWYAEQAAGMREQVREMGWKETR